MDIALGRDLLARTRGIQGRIFSFSHSRPGLVRKGAGCLLVVLAGLLAFFARDVMRRELEADWERSHAPSALIWEHALGSLGYRPVRDPSILGKAMRTLPSSVDEKSTVWISPDSPWVVVYGMEAGSGTQEPAVFTAAEGFANPRRERKKKRAPGPVGDPGAHEFPAQWQPVGAGWSAFEAALPAARKSALAYRVAKPQPKTRIPPDPRAILY